MAEDSLQPAEAGKPYPRSDQDYLLNFIINDDNPIDVVKMAEALFFTARETGFLEFISPSTNVVTLRIDPEYEPSVKEMPTATGRLRMVLPHIAVRSKESYCEVDPNLYGFEADVDIVMLDKSTFKCHILMENTTGSQRLVITARRTLY